MVLHVFPNPVTDQVVHIDYTLEKTGPVTCQIYDATGRMIKTLAVGEQRAGKHSLFWDRKDNDGILVNGGIYFIKFDTATDHARNKLILID